jgi:hypothetical protein
MKVDALLLPLSSCCSQRVGNISRRSGSTRQLALFFQRPAQGKKQGDSHQLRALAKSCNAGDTKDALTVGALPWLLLKQGAQLPQTSPPSKSCQEFLPTDSVEVTEAASLRSRE